MKRTYASLLLFLFILAAEAQSLGERLDKILEAYSAMDKFNGTALVSQNGKTILSKGYGYKNLETKTRNDEQTIFQIGSVTKQFTAAIILKLQEGGKLKLTDKLSKYFPGYANGERITLYQLLTHTSGIYNYTNDANKLMSEASKSQSREAIMALFKDKPLDFEPGTGYRYSNSAYSLLGYIIEDITGRKYEAMVREWIFEPLQMRSSGFDFINLKSTNKAIGYSFIRDGKGVKMTIVDSTIAFSAGAIYSTVTDLKKWAEAIQAGKLLNKDSWQSAFTPNKNKYALGWVIDTLHGNKTIGHTGGIFGFTSYLLRFPEAETEIILLSNGSDVLVPIANMLAAALFNKPYELPKQRLSINLEQSMLDEYVGEYAITPVFSLKIFNENGKLKAQATGQQKTEIFAERKDFFFLKVVDAQLEFGRDSEGKIDRLYLHQGGLKQEAKRIK